MRPQYSEKAHTTWKPAPRAVWSAKIINLSAQKLSFLDNTLLKCLFILVIPSLNIVCRYWVIYSDVRNASAVLQPHHPSSPLTRSSRLWHTETNSAHSVTSSGHHLHWATSFIIRAANDSSVFTITEKAINTMLNASVQNSPSYPSVPHIWSHYEAY